MSEPKLLPCPWCSWAAIHTEPDTAQGYKWGYACCGACSARGPEVRTNYLTADDAPWRAEALKAWNTLAKPEHGEG